MLGGFEDEHFFAFGAFAFEVAIFVLLKLEMHIATVTSPVNVSVSVLRFYLLFHSATSAGRHIASLSDEWSTALSALLHHWCSPFLDGHNRNAYVVFCKRRDTSPAGFLPSFSGTT
jgi:hypothetical protein